MNNSNDIYSKQLEAIKRLNEAQDSFDEVQNDLKDKYSVSHLIGSGAYGSVWRGTSLTPKVFPNESTNVAIKRIRNRKNVLYCLKRTLREIKILRHFKHDNIVSLCDVIISQNESSLYLVLDLMETDLHKIIQSPQPLSIDHVRWFLYQILRALKFLHSANVVHRDIKPSNLLVNSNCLLKLADFGMARCLNDLGNNEVSETSSNPLTACNSADGTQTRNEFTTDTNVRNHKLQATIYVATRWYRSPELILCHSEYTTSIDMWSVGCIVAELFLRRPLFPGKSQVNQLNLIISLLGNPKPSYIEKIKSDSIRAYVNSLPALTSTVSFRQKIPTCESREALDFIQRLLIWEPNDRLPSELAIAHPFLKAHYRPDQEPICCRPYDYAFESSLANCEQLHNAVLNEIERIAEQKRRLIKLVKKRELEKQCDWSSSYTEVVVDFTKENKIENFANESESEKACDVDSESGRVKREQSLEVKARLRAAILSDAWRSKGQRRTRTGRPKNSSKVSKKKIEETRMSFMPKSNIVPNHEKESAKLSGASSLKSPVPSISKQELMSVTQFKQPAGPITVKIITGNAHDQSRQQVVTLSFVQPKAANAVIAKGGKLPVPKLSCAKNNAANAALKAANLNAPTSMSRANLVKSVQAVSKRNETMNKDAKLTDAASAMLSAIPRVCNPSAATIPTSLPSFSLNASVKNNKAFDESLTDTRKSSCVSSKQQILIGADSHQGSKSDFANLKGASPAKKPVKSNVGLLPIDHCSYISMPESNASPQNLQSSANDTDIRFFSDVNNRTKPSTSQRGAKGEVVANRASVTENKKNLGEYRTSESVNLGAESDVKIDKMQAFLPSLYMDNSNWIGTGKPNRDKSDAQMPSARLVASVVSSASTEPGNAADEMDDLINKMSSSSLRPELDAFAEFLDIPLSAVLTGNDDKLVNSKVSTPSLPMHTSPCGYNCLSSQFKADYGGGQFIPESHGKQGEESQLHNGHISTNQNTVQENSILANPNAAIQAAFPANPIAERQNSSIANQSLDRQVSFNDRDFRAAFDITSAEMQDIENELKKDFSFLDFSLLELESPS